MIRTMNSFITVFLVVSFASQAGFSAENQPNTATPFEKVPQDEQENIKKLQGLVALMQKQQGLGLRGQHPKAHGCAKATFQVLENLSGEWQFGLFKEPRTYEAYVRLSNGKEMDDRIPESSHGMAIKVIGVEGEKLLPEEKYALTQDFLLVDSPTFFSRNPGTLFSFVSSLGQAVAMAGGDEKAAMQARQQFILDGENQKKFPEIGQLLERITAHSEKIGDDKIVSNLRNPLSTTYHSATPYLLGDDDTQFMVRYKVVPSGQPEDGAFDNNKDSLGAAMSKQLEELSRPATFTFIISRYNGNDLEGTAEDPTVVWDATIEAPVAHITIYPQDIASEEAKLLCESLSFTPWHSLPNHQPIGGINRARLSIYQASSKIRHETTGQARVEPEHTW